MSTTRHLHDIVHVNPDLSSIDGIAGWAVERRPVADSAKVTGVVTLPGRTVLLAEPAPTGPRGAPSRAIALDDRLRVVARANVGRDARNLAADPTRNRLYVVNRGPEGAGVSMLDATTLVPLGHRAIDAGLHDVAVDPAAGLVYVSHWIRRRIIVLRADDLSPVQEIGDASFTGALGLAVDPDLGHILVARTFRSGEPNVEALSVIRRGPDGQHVVQSTRALGQGVQPWDVAVDPEAGLVYVLGLGGGGVPPQLIVLDRGGLGERGRVEVAGTPLAVAAQPGTGIAHVATGLGVQIVDGRRAEVAALVPGRGTPCVAVGERDRIVAGAVDGEVVRVQAARSLPVVEWR